MKIIKAAFLALFMLAMILFALGIMAIPFMFCLWLGKVIFS